MADGRSYTTTFKTKAETQGISEMQKKLQDLQKNLRDNKSEQKELSKEIRSSEKEFKQIEKEIAKTGKTTEEQRNRLEQLKSTIEADRTAIEQLKLQEAQLKAQMDETSKQIDAEKEALSKLKTSMSDAKSAAGELAKEVTAIGAAATAAVAGLFAFTYDAAQWADDINTLSKITGISTDELQKFAYASDLIDVSVDTLSGSLTKLTRNMSTAAENADSSAAKAFYELNISVTDTTGQLRDRQEVFYEVIDALGKLENETQRDAFAMDIFGRSAQQLNPLIKGGAEALRQIGEEAEKAGLILSQDTLDSLNEFNDKVDELKAKGNAIKELAASEMTPALDGLIEVGDQLLDEIKQMAASGELKRVAREVGTAIKNGAQGLKNIISFVWKYKEAIGAALTAMIAFKVSMSIANLINSLIIGFKALNTATKSETTSMAALNTVMNANPIGLVVSAVAALTFGLISLGSAMGSASSATKNYNEELDVLLKKQSEAEASAVAEGKEVELLNDEYNRLREKTNLTTREKERLNTVCEQLAGKLGLTTEELKNQEGAYRDLTGEVEKYIKKLKEQAKYDYYKDIITESAKSAEQIKADLEVAEKARDAFLKNNITAYGEYIRILNSQGHDISPWASTFPLDILITRLNQQLADAEKAGENAEEAYRKLGEGADDAADKTGVLTGALDIATAALKGVNDALEDDTDASKKLSDELSTLQKQGNSLRSEMNSLANSMKQLESGEALSLSTLLDLIDKYPEYASELLAASGNADLQRQALEKLFEAKKQDYILTQQATIDNIKASRDETSARLENIQKQINAYQALGSVIGAVMTAQLSAQLRNYDELIAAYEKKIDFIRSISIDDLSSSGSRSGSSGSFGGSVSSAGKNSRTVTYTSRFKGEVFRSDYSYEDGAFDAVKAADAQAKATLGVLDRVKNLGKLTLNEEIHNLQELLKREQISDDMRYDLRLRLYKAQEQLAKDSADKQKELADKAAKAQEEAEKRLLERQNLALAAYNRLVNGKIEQYEAETKAAQDKADKEIAAIDAVMKKRQQEQDDLKRQKELDQINARLQYQQMDEFARLELERRRQDILNEQADISFERSMENKKIMYTAGAEGISNRNARAIAGLQASQTQFADRMAYLQGNQTFDQRVKNNSITQNLTVIQNGMSDDQAIKRLADKIKRDLGA